MTFRVMSFNIRGADHPGDGANQWQYRAALNVATIRKYAPDVIGFQELQDGNLTTYQAELNEYQHHSGQRGQRRQRTPDDLLEARHARPARLRRLLDQRDAGSLFRLVEYRLRARGDLGAFARKDQRRRIPAPEHPPRSPQRLGAHGRLSPDRPAHQRSAAGDAPGDSDG